jgi:quinoprotein glucose dehydrogenase
VVALDAKTGELIWSHSLREGQRAANAARQLSGRGVSYWTDGRGDERIIYVTTGFRLVELNAKTGAVITSFATDGILDLKVGVMKGNDEQIDLEAGEIGVAGHLLSPAGRECGAPLYGQCSRPARGFRAGAFRAAPFPA